MEVTIEKPTEETQPQTECKDCWSLHFESVPVLEGCICAGFNDTTKLKLEAQWLQLAEKYVCLNLKTSTDRYNASVEQFHRYGLCRLATFYRTTRPSPELIRELQLENPGQYAVWEGHRFVMRQGVTQQLKSVFMFEDDFLFVVPDEERLAQRLAEILTLKKELDAKNAYDCLYFGGLTIAPRYAWSDVSDGLLWKCPRVFTACTHAYLARPSLIRSLADTPFTMNAAQRGGEEQPLDWFFIQHFQQRMVMPQIIVQRMEHASDNKTQNKKETSTLLNWLEQTVAGPLLGFLQHHPTCYDVLIMVVMPLLLLLLLMACAYFGLKRLYRWMFPKGSSHPLRPSQPSHITLNAGHKDRAEQPDPANLVSAISTPSFVK